MCELQFPLFGNILHQPALSVCPLIAVPVSYPFIFALFQRKSSRLIHIFVVIFLYILPLTLNASPDQSLPAVRPCGGRLRRGRSLRSRAPVLASPPHRASPGGTLCRLAYRESVVAYSYRVTDSYY